MRNLMLGAITAASLLAGAGAVSASPMTIAGAAHPGDVLVEKSQYIYYGHDYCWYEGGWRGPGWYWCGYAWNRGYGWGGGPGWRGWYYGRNYWRGGVWIGPGYYHHREWGGWRGERDWHGRGHWDHDRGEHRGWEHRDRR